MSEKIKLKPCPFCGGIKYLQLLDSRETFPNRTTWIAQFVNCPECGTCGPEANTAEEAIEKWNNRHAAKLVEAWR